jgi:DUF4097 and DUF4098 domain-containing protein YvlB
MTVRMTVVVLLCALAHTTVPTFASAQETEQPADPRPRPAAGQRDRRRVAEGLQRAQERLRRTRDARQERRAARQGNGVTESVSRVVKLGRDGNIELTNVAGRVTVTGTNGDDVRIEAVKHLWHRDESTAQGLLKDLDIEVSEGPGRVGIRTRFPRERSYDAEVDYTVSVPQRASVSIRAASGDVTVSNVRGSLRVEAVNGSVSATGVGDVVMARSVSGDVAIDGATGAEITASTVGGSITVQRSKATTIDLRSAGGAVRVTAGEAERVSLQSFRGDVEFDGPIGRNGRYELASRTGAVTVTPTGTDSFDVEATTLRGEFRSDFALTLHESSRAVARAGAATRTTVGTAGKGGGLLTLRSASGRITIARRP